MVIVAADHNRLGFGLQLKTLPYLGFVPDDLTDAPARVVSYLALQLSVSTDKLQQYGDREHRRTDHLREIQDRLGFHDAGQHQLAVLSTWLLDRALEHDRPVPPRVPVAVAGAPRSTWSDAHRTVGGDDPRTCAISDRH